MPSRALRSFVLCVLCLVACSDGKRGASPGPDAGPGGSDAGAPRDAGGPDAQTPPRDAGDGADGGQLAGDKARVTSVAPTYAVADEPYKYGPKSSEPGQTAWKVAEGPAGMGVDGDGVIVWQPTKEQAGQHRVTVTSQGGQKAVTQTSTVTVATSQKRAEGKVAKDTGGTVTVAAPKSNIQGASISVAKDAVASDTTVTVSQLDASPKMAGKKGETRAVQFGPSGTTFAAPALVSLPLPRDVVLDPRRVGGFVYDPRGRWQRIEVVRVDLAQRVLHARARHFSVYLGAQTSVGLALSLGRMAESSGCPGRLAASVELDGALHELDGAAVNNPSEALSARLEDGVDDVAALVFSPAFRGSLRVVRVVELSVREGDGLRAVERAVLVSTLFAPGDGSAVVTHADALGNELSRSRFTSLVDEAGDIERQLRGEATHALLAEGSVGAFALAARLHLVYFEGDASLDPVNVEELGLAAVDEPAGAPVEPLELTADEDVDCDRLRGAYDGVDDRVEPALHGTPADVLNTVVGAEVALAVEPLHVQGDGALRWEVLGGDAELRTEPGDARVRRFVAAEPGRFQVLASLSAAGRELTHLFVLDVAARPVSLPSCAPSSTAAALRAGESTLLTAVIGDGGPARDALTVEWGTLDGGLLVADPQLAETGRFTPEREGVYEVACRVRAGDTLGPVGSIVLQVVAAEANRLPVDLTLSPPSATLRTGESLMLVAAGMDPDGDTLHFAWSASGGELGAPSDEGGESRAAFKSESAGAFDVSVEIRDDSELGQVLRARVVVVAQGVDPDGADGDGDGWPVALDCDDQRADVHPGAVDGCGNAVDEDCSGSARTEDCDGDGQTALQGDCDDSNPARQAGATELCNGVDDDCSGAADDGFSVGTPCTAGLGGCLRQGAYQCAQDGASVWCDARPGEPAREQCNLIDDDCDGQTDEDLASVATDCGVGACAATGVRACVQGALVDSCVAGEPAARDATCDARDDDCDGTKDEDFVSGETTCGVGACRAVGTSRCVGGQVVDDCRAGTPAVGDGTCDGVDDDCSGESDEDYQAAVTACGAGVCRAEGRTSCVDGTERDSCVAGPSAGLDNRCDGVDQDCTGVADDGFVSLLEVCNGGDDDCDGSVDEGLSCHGGSTPCEPTGPELCNTRDDDCDGLFDEEHVCGLDLAEGSLLGAWWFCSDASCTVLGDEGIVFAAGGVSFDLRSLDGEPYDPAFGPYCGGDASSWSVEGSTLTVRWQEGGVEREVVGALSFAGHDATVTWIVPPEDGVEFTYLTRVPEQPAGACQRGPTCAPAEDCQNGFDDDCDGATDSADLECTGCTGVPSPEVCDGRDNDCDGAIDDLGGSCEAAALGVCQVGHLVCGPGSQPACVAGQPDLAGEVCPDGLDNDCDGVIDEPDCTPLSAENCFNPLDVSAGGVYRAPLGERDDVSLGCWPAGYRDRVFMFQVPPGLGLEYTISLQGPPGLDVGGVLIEAPAAWQPGMTCPAVGFDKALCLASQASFKQYLSGGRTYLLIVESEGRPDVPAGAELTLSIGRRADGICVPASTDDDGVSICDGDCDDTRGDVHPGAPELCNGRDDDCDGLSDEQSGTCATGLTGVCATGLPTCGGPASCLPIQTGSGVDYCDDGADNDCDGQVDEDCVAAAGEACTNGLALGLGGTFRGSLAGRADDAVSRCHPHTAGEAELFYRFSMPAAGAKVVFDSRAGNVRFALYRDCTLDVVSCYVFGLRDELPAGDYLLAVEQEGPGPGGLDFAFSLGFIGRDGACLTPDLDGDGVTVCDGDCDESDPLIHRGASEGDVCNQVDDDCDGAIDDVSAPCSVAGQLGVCQDGQLHCAGDGSSTCAQVEFGDLAGRDYCGDDLDNDCDGAADEAGCVELPVGDVCTLAEDVGQGGQFAGTLDGYGDDASTGCARGEGAGAERFYAVALGERRVLTATVRGSGGVAPVLALLDGCRAPAALRCASDRIDAVLEPGRYLLAVEGAGGAYELTVASARLDDPNGSTCLPPDGDGDGFTLCAGDCRDGNAGVHPAAPEVCDGLDNNCNGVIDEPTATRGPEACEVEGGVGECARGVLQCVDGDIACSAMRSPGQFVEVCGTGLDEDCDGLEDDAGQPGTDCVAANAESCELALPLPKGAYLTDSLAGATHDGNGCYGGTAGDAEEKYYRFEVDAPGYAYLTVTPIDTAAPPPYAVGIFHGACPAPANFGCTSSASLGAYYLPEPGTYFVVVESDEPFAYRVQLAQLDGAGSCLGGDLDGDEHALCGADCDDANPDVFSGAAEVCDGLDNDCNGARDDLAQVPCETALPGVCTPGHRACSGSEELCLPNREPRVRDICGDGLDNDCDGLSDEPDCDALPAGETCELARDVTGGGAFDGTLSGASDDGDHCGMAGQSDRYFSFNLAESASVYLDVVALGPPVGTGGPLSTHLFSSCGGPVSLSCGFPRQAGVRLEPGDYLVAVEGANAQDFRLFVAFEFDGACLSETAPLGDFDGDGTSLCAGDCDESSAAIGPHASEVCGNLRDDDCDGYVDAILGAACTSEQPGECAAGRLECPAVGSVPVCVPLVTPGSQPELCDDLLDNDCNAGVDEQPCTVATGANCALPISLDAAPGLYAGRIDDAQDDVYGCGTSDVAEQVFRLTPQTSGYLFVLAGPARTGEGTFRVRSAEGNCFGPSQCHEYAGGEARFVQAGVPLVLIVEGPLGVDYRLFWALRPGDDRSQGPCFDGLSGEGFGDFDGDGVSLCDNDCDEADPSAHAGAPEICGNGRDDDCDRSTDTVSSASCETGLLGVCGFGSLACRVSGEPASCEPLFAPSPEVCNAADDDCDGLSDEDGVCGG